MGNHSRRKGHQFERDIAKRLKHIFPDVRRQLEYHTSDCNGVDLQGTERFKFQCKRLKKYASINAIKEIICNRKEEVPVLVTAGDAKEAMVVMPFSYFVLLLKTVQNATSPNALPEA